jgi:hypothetical protein
MQGLRQLLDAIPRTRVGVLGREAPAFRTAGVCGYYLALLAVLLAGPLAGRSLFALVGASSVCAFSFFGYALLRKSLTGREQLVLLEHVWVALLASGGFLWVAEVPVRAHLDAVVVGLAFFLACGRVGCAMVGCCHGRPSELGLRYGEDAVRDGFPRELQGVPLFPVQLVESLGLTLLGFVLVPVLFLGPPGAALGTFLVGYGVMRFGLEGLRGDARPHLLGLSQSRWMALAEVTFALALSVPRHALLAPERPVVAGTASALFGLALLIGFSWRAARKELRLFSSEHLAELRDLVDDLAERAGREPLTATSSLGVRIAASRLASHGFEATLPHQFPPGFALSFSQPAGTRETRQLIRLGRAVARGRLGEPKVLRNGAVLFRNEVVERASEPASTATPPESKFEASGAAPADSVRDGYFHRSNGVGP